MKLQKFEQLTSDGKPDGTRYVFWCPACKETHSYLCGRPEGRTPNWTFNGDEKCPSFHASLLMFCPTVKPDFDRSKGEPKYPDDYDRHIRCHLFVREGRIEYCADCPHELAGQTIDLPDIPPEHLW